MFPFSPEFVRKQGKGQAANETSSGGRKSGRKKRDRDSTSSLKDAGTPAVDRGLDLKPPTAPTSSSSVGPPSAPAIEEPTSNISSYYEDGSMSSIPGSSSTLSCILVYNQTCVRYASGACKMTLLRGKASINGYSLPLNECIDSINFPCWTPCARLYAGAVTGGSKTPSKKKVKKDSSPSSTIITALDKLGKLNFFENLKNKNVTEMNVLDASTCLILMEGIPREKQEWMVAAEDQPFTTMYNAKNVDMPVDMVQLPREGEFVSVQVRE